MRRSDQLIVEREERTRLAPRQAVETRSRTTLQSCQEVECKFSARRHFANESSRAGQFANSNLGERRVGTEEVKYTQYGLYGTGYKGRYQNSGTL